MQNAIEKFRYPDVVGEQLRPALNFTFLLELSTELIVLVNESFWLQLKSLVLLQRKTKLDDASLQTLLTVSRYSTLSVPLFFSL